MKSVSTAYNLNVRMTLKVIDIEDHSDIDEVLTVCKEAIENLVARKQTKLAKFDLMSIYATSAD